jgi:hypothetical protein
MTNSGKAFGIVWKFAHGRSLGTSIGQIFPDNSCGFSTFCPKHREDKKLDLAIDRIWNYA